VLSELSRCIETKHVLFVVPIWVIAVNNNYCVAYALALLRC
jgi:hypothetical protein